VACIVPKERIGVKMLSSTAAPAGFTRSSLVPRGIGIVGCLAVAVIHIVDQGGLPGSKGPEYIHGISPRYTFLILGIPPLAMLRFPGERDKSSNLQTDYGEELL
jgi:hypothetical protein